MTRPEGVLRNDLPSHLPRPAASSDVDAEIDAIALKNAEDMDGKGSFAGRGLAGRLRRIFR
jgi:hypothetical protein